MKKLYSYSLSSVFIIGAILFWGVPVLSGFIDEVQTTSLTRAFTEVIQPTFCILSGYVYTKNVSFTWYLPIGMMLLYLPVCFVYYTLDMLLWIPIYGAFNLIGCVVASIIKKRSI